MSRVPRLASGLVALVASLGCGTRSEPAPIAASTLPAGVIAQLDGEAVSGASVASIAERQRLEPRAALSRALAEALFAAAARSRLPDGATSSIERAAAARSMLERLSAESAEAGPPSDEEVAQFAHDRWAELDRPDAARTTHAVVANTDPKRDASARALAEKIAKAVSAATSAEEFIGLAKAVPADDLKVTAEELPAMTLEGRAIQRTEKGFVGLAGGFDKAFARAANELQQVGELSPIVKTRFGYHVIRLAERIPGNIVSKAEIARTLAPELRTRRTVRLRSKLLETLRGSSAVQIDRAVDELTARVQLSP